MRVKLTMWARAMVSVGGQIKMRGHYFAKLNLWMALSLILTLKQALKLTLTLN